MMADFRLLIADQQSEILNSKLGFDPFEGKPLQRYAVTTGAAAESKRLGFILGNTGAWSS
jgi:hypothetical protein